MRIRQVLCTTVTLMLVISSSGMFLTKNQINLLLLHIVPSCVSKILFLCVIMHVHFQAWRCNQLRDEPRDDFGHRGWVMRCQPVHGVLPKKVGRGRHVFSGGMEVLVLQGYSSPGELDIASCIAYHVCSFFRARKSN